MRLIVVRQRELHRVRGDHGQAHAGGQLHRGDDMGLVIGASGALQLQVKTMHKDAAQLQRGIKGARLVTLHQGLPHGPGLRPRQGDQTLVQLRQPR